MANKIHAGLQDGTQKLWQMPSRQTLGYAAAMGVLGVALIIIGSLALKGHLTGIVAGGCAIGLSVPAAIATIVKMATSGDAEKCSGVIILVNLAALTVFGALTCAGLMSGFELGYVILPLTIGTLAVIFRKIFEAACFVSCATCCIAGVSIGEAGIRRGLEETRKNTAQVAY